MPTLAEMKEEKKRMETLVYNLIREFEKNHEVEVVDISIEKSRQLGRQTPVSIAIRMEVRL